MWLDPAQRCLYRSPLRASGITKSYQRVCKLCNLLEDRPRLANYVRSLSQLAAVQDKLMEEREEPRRHNQHVASATARRKALRARPEDVEGEEDDSGASDDGEESDLLAAALGNLHLSRYSREDILQIGRRIVKSCRKVTSLSSVIESEHAGHIVGRLVRDRNLEALELRSTSTWVFEPEMVYEVIKQLDQDSSSLRRLTLRDVDSSDAEEDYGSSLDPEEVNFQRSLLKINELVLIDCEISEAQIVSFIPRIPDTLTLLHITSNQLDSELVESILAEVGTQLVTLSLKTSYTDYDTLTLTEYDDGHDGWEVTHEIFKTLPRLRQLTLHHAQGLSLGALAFVEECSSDLEWIDLKGSLWDAVEFTDPVWQQMIERVVLKLPHLARLHLGWLPYTIGRTFPLIENACRKQDVQLTYALCVDEDESDEEDEDDESVSEEDEGNYYDEYDEDDGWEDERSGEGDSGSDDEFYL